MNAMKRFVELLKLPLMPIRLFAVGDDSDYDWTDDFDFSGTDEEAGYYDAEGNYLGDDEAAAEEAAESHDDSSIDPDNWAEYDDDFGEVSVQTDGNGNILSTSYKDPTTGEWKDSGLSGYKEAYGRTSEGQAKQASDVFGASMTPETLAALNNGNAVDVSTALSNAAQGDPAALAMATAMTGTVPDADSLKGLGYTDDQINTAVTFAETMTQALGAGKSPTEAWQEASTKTGDPYGTNARDQMLKDTVINTILTYGTLGLGTAAGLASGANTFKTSGTSVQFVRGLLNSLGIGGRYAGRAGAATVNTAARLLNDLDKGASAASIISGLISAGMTAADAKALVDEHTRQMKTSESDEKTPDATPTAVKPASEPEPTATSKPDPAFTNPWGKDPGEISVPKGPLDGTSLSGTGLPGHESEGTETEPTKEDAEDRGFESDSSDSSDESGADTFEESSQDAPSSGLGGETFSNPNDDTEKNGWGLGEEDPNRANYDNDKWNRGMERVSTDVVSDEKCKSFINKTFKDDPVLIKTVKIMKTLK